MFSKQSLFVGALLGCLVFVGLFTFLYQPTVTGSVAGTRDDPRQSGAQLLTVLIEPYDGNEDVILRPDIRVQQKYGTSVVAVIPSKIIDELRTKAKVEIVNQK